MTGDFRPAAFGLPCVLVAMAIFLTTTVVAAQECEHEKTPLVKKEAKNDGGGFKAMSIPDVPVVTQEGRRLNFYSDLVKGRVVAINFVFTSCTTICPPLAANFSKLQGLGGDRTGSDFALISISVDPVTDTPERLKTWGRRFNVKEGWTLVTGRKDDITKLLKALGGFSARIEDHTPIVLIGNEAAGAWTRAYGLAPPDTLLRLLDAAVNGRPLDLQEASKTKWHEHR